MSEGQRKACGSQPELSRRRRSRTCKGRIWFGLFRLEAFSAQRAPARRRTLASGAGDPYNAGVKVGRDFAMFGSEADLAFIVRTLKESVRTF